MNDRDLSTSPRQTPKRPRPVVSCLQCRTKKLKCDRRLPCSKCIKGGRRDACEYAAGQEPLSNDDIPYENGHKRQRTENNLTDPSLAAAAAKFDDLQHRVRQLEQALQLTKEQSPTTPVITPSTTNGLIRPAAETASQLSLSVRSPLERPVISYFEVIQDFADCLGRDGSPTELSTVASDLRSLHEMTASVHRPHRDFRIHSNAQDVLHHMEELLPPPHTCHALIEHYFNYFENCTRILHRGTSMSLFRAYFNGTLTPAMKAIVLPKLIAALSAISSLAVFPECDQPALHGHFDGVGAYQLLRNILELISDKDWLEVSTIQIALLTLRYHKSSPLTELSMWQWSGQILRRAIAAGVHRKPDIEHNVFESETKRRLWLTAIELDLSLAIASGMPANCPIWRQHGSPMNVDDSQLYPGMQEQPSDDHDGRWTDGICQHVLAQSINERMLAYKSVSTESIDDYSEVLQHTRRLEQIIHDLPLTFRFGPSTDEASDTPHRLMAKMELDFLLRRPLNACYAPYAIAMPPDDRYKQARIPWIQGCTISICFQDLFDPKYPTLDLPEPEGLWDYFYNVYKWDADCFMLANCLELQRLRSLHDEAPDAPSPAFHGHALRTPVKVMGWSIESITKSLEDTIDPLARRVGRHGSGLRDVVRWTAIIGSLRVNPSCSRLHAIKNELQGLTSTLKSRLTGRSGVAVNSASRGNENDARVNMRWVQRYLMQSEDDTELDD